MRARDLIRSLSLSVSGLDHRQIQVVRNDAEALTQYLENRRFPQIVGITVS